jgi:aryl-alcohol dehydrogenase-like predicted oxidoreductase
MQYRKLGKTNFHISEVGFGTWQIADDPNMWVGADPVESMRCLHKFVENGGNFIDTAWVYGWDDAKPDIHPSEQLIGKFLKESGNKENIYVATKIAPKNMLWPARIGKPISEVFPHDHIVKSVEDSLRSLGVDNLDLVQFHVWLDDFAHESEWKETIQKLTKEGKVKFWGISINDYQPSNCLQTLDTGLIATIQTIFNIFHQKPTEKLFPYVRKHDIGIIARVPLDEGGLTGTITMDTEFPEGDLRKYYFKGERRKELVKRLEALKTLLGSEAKTLPELALRYILSFDEVSTVIPGMRHVKNVEANVSLSDGRKLSPSLLEELKSYSWERNFYAVFDPTMKDTQYIEA